MKTVKRCLAGIYLLLLSHGVWANDHWATVAIEPTSLNDTLYMLVGEGGNIVASVGADGTFLIDGQYAPLSEKIIATVKELSGDMPMYLVNTHWHGDHTGGNENFGTAGSVIVAHENVRVALESSKTIAMFNLHKAPSPKAALPVITFQQGMTFHLNGDTVELVHVANAHTDGDTFVHFKKANVIHAGDTFFNGIYPFIDSESGGSIDGMIAAADRILSRSDEHTKIIPGHGALGDKVALTAYRDMLATVRATIQTLIDAGKTEAEIIAAKPTAAFDAEWGDGFLAPDVWVKVVYSSMGD